MAEFILQHGFLTGAAILLCALGIVLRTVTGILLSSLLKETENMTATDNRLLKQFKAKFQNCYKLKDGALNVPIFVDKFLNNIQLGKCSLNFLVRLSNQIILLSIAFLGSGACLAIAKGYSPGKILPYYVLAILELYLYFAVFGLADINSRIAMLKTNLVDYLENCMSSRMKQARKDELMLEELERSAAEEKKAEAKKAETRKVETRNTETEKSTDQKTAAHKRDNDKKSTESSELDELLGEFLA